MKLFRSRVFVLMITVAAVTAAACTQDPGGSDGKGAASHAQAEPGVSSAKAGGEQGSSGDRKVEIVGKVDRTNEGVVLESVNETYIVVNGKDLSGMLGKDVRVIGSLGERNGLPAIEVKSVSVIERS